MNTSYRRGVVHDRRLGHYRSAGQLQCHQRHIGVVESVVEHCGKEHIDAIQVQSAANSSVTSPITGATGTLR